MSSHDDEQGVGAGPRQGQSPPPSGQPQYGQPQYGQPQYGAAGQPYGSQQYQPSPHGPSPHGQGQPPPSGYPQYGPPGGYGQYAPQGQYGQYGQYAPPGQYGQYGQYGPGPVPARPTPVVVAAVLGFVFSALGGLVALVLGLGGAVLGTVFEDLAASDPAFEGVDTGEVTDAALLLGVGLGVLALLWTALMVWGSVRALTGRSRVPLLVGGAISVAATASFLLAVLSGVSTGEAGGGEVVFALLFFLAALAVVVLLCLRPAAQFYAAHRARRGR